MGKRSERVIDEATLERLRENETRYTCPNCEEEKQLIYAGEFPEILSQQSTDEILLGCPSCDTIFLLNAQTGFIYRYSTNFAALHAIQDKTLYSDKFICPFFDSCDKSEMIEKNWLGICVGNAIFGSPQRVPSGVFCSKYKRQLDASIKNLPKKMKFLKLMSLFNKKR